MLLNLRDKLQGVLEEAAGWIKAPDSGPNALQAAVIVLRSYGQVVFAAHAVSGLFLLIALATISRSTVWFSLVGIAAASLSAYAFRAERSFIRQGIFGFNGALLGIFWSWYFTVSIVSVLLLVVMAVIVYLVQSFLMNKLSLGRFNLPVMSLPSVIVLIASLLIVYWLVYNAWLIPASAIYRMGGYTAEPLIPMEGVLKSLLPGLPLPRHVVAWLLIFTGILIFSRISAFAAALGALSGYAITRMLPATTGVLYTSDLFIGFNAIPVSIGLLGVFLVANGPAFFFTFAGLVVCSVFWLLLIQLFGLLNFPFLTLPFNLTILAVLITLKKMNSPPAGLYPVPLEVITTPEQIILWHKNNILPRAAVKTPETVAQLLLHPSRLFRPSREEINAVQVLVDGAEKIAVLSGAGTSTESGIPDFRGHYNFWRKFGAEDFTYQNFLNREDVRARYWAMERQFYAMILRARVNPTHQAVKWLDDQNRLSCIVTQNVDGLFQKAGVNPEKVIEIHGTEHQVRCLNCGAIGNRQDIETMFPAGIYIPYCYACYGWLKPATVLMGEELDKALFESALSKILSSDLLIIMGTSLQVDPVASIPALAWKKGIPIIIINSTPTPQNHLSKLFIHCPTGKFFRKFLRQVEKRR